ncbi:MAG TPA: hypothetical protein VGL00_19140 [Terracidiphilus sp.]
MPEKDELDRLLDSALASYADPGTGSGLEQRVLSSLAAPGAQGNTRSDVAGYRRWPARYRRWPAWAVAVPVAAALLLWFSIAKIHHAPAIQNQEAHQANGPQAPAASAPSHPDRSGAHNQTLAGAKPLIDSQAVMARLKSRPDTGPNRSTATEAVNPEPLPKLDVFPTPQPLTPQEQALVVVAAQTPEPELRALIEAEKQNGQPFPIAAAHIPPLEPPDEGAHDRQ